MNRTLESWDMSRLSAHSSSAGGIYMQAASGRVADALAKHYDKVYICARVVHGPPLVAGRFAV